MTLREISVDDTMNNGSLQHLQINGPDYEYSLLYLYFILFSDYPYIIRINSTYIID